LVIDETGDRKDGHQTAHVGRQYLGKLGKIDNGVVSGTRLWADEQVYYPLEIEPYTPESYFAKGRNDPNFRYLRSKSPCSLSNRRYCKDGLSVRWWLTPSMERIVA
jgi:DDE superfamily endonuclease